MMQRQRSAITAILPLVLLTLLGCSESADNTSKKTPAQTSAYTPQVGDVIFQSSNPSELIDMIEGASQSHYSHCGIVDRVDGRWVVYEAASQVSTTPLDTFLDRGRGGGFAAYRFKTSYQDKIPAIITNTRAYLGRPYDFRYRLDEEHIYCSELIYKAFEQATGEPLGILVRLGDLKWQAYEPLILRLEGGPVPLDREIITPIDLALAEQLEVVHARSFEVTER